MADLNINLTTAESIVDKEGKPVLGFLFKWQRKLSSVGDMYAEGSLRRKVFPLAASDVDCKLGNYYTVSVAGDTTFTFSNAPAGAYEFTLEMLYASGVLTFPAEVSWPSATVPTWAAGTWLVTFSTSNQGADWYGSALGPFA